MPRRDIDDLSADELENLLKKRRAADKQARGGRHTLNVALDLGDSAQVKLARKLGFIDADDDDDQDDDAGADGDTDDADDGDDTPSRGGYFKE